MSGKKVALLGAAGGIGQPLALLLKMHLPAGSTLNLADIVNVPGVAVDLSHIDTAVRVNHYMGPDKLHECLTGVDLVIIPAGVPRKPGMTRDDLFNVNAGIVAGLVAGAAKACPNAFIAIITNPVNSTVPIAAEVLKKAGVYNPAKLCGVTTLDVVRANTFVAEAKGMDVARVNVRCVGGHSGNTILPLLSQVSGVSFTPAEITALTDRIRNAGTEVVDAKAGAGSATLSMAYAALKFVNVLIAGLNGAPDAVACAYIEAPASARAPAKFFALPVRFGPQGIAGVQEIGAVNASEQAAITGMLAELNDNIAKGEGFVANPPAKPQ
eukprot:gnl/Hemi2/870_TR315_c0_g1_i1.p1 gnl/Hemi2/870_TR315_c0_g1~~gnl/Hemi2/870_TR315_c0_g1_i1.p1  ORF type:complete len:343 (+),score=142.28 gnl/Hemi2/870_TR315_c0_g1_i1:55-1029(+)